MAALEKKVETSKREKEEAEKKQKSLETKIIDLENENEALQKQNRFDQL